MFEVLTEELRVAESTCLGLLLEGLAFQTPPVLLLPVPVTHNHTISVEVLHALPTSRK